MSPSQSISCNLNDEEKIALHLVAHWYDFDTVGELVRFSLDEICGAAWNKATTHVKNGEFHRPEKHPGRPPKKTNLP